MIFSWLPFRFANQKQPLIESIDLLHMQTPQCTRPISHNAPICVIDQLKYNFTI